MALLRQHPKSGENFNEVNLLGRVLPTLEWLSSNPQNVSHMVDLVASDGLAMAIDAIRISQCGQMLQLQGWLVDPKQQLRELCLVRGERGMAPEPGPSAIRTRFSQTRCGGDDQLDAGLKLSQLAPTEEAVPLQAGRQQNFSQYWRTAQ